MKFGVNGINFIDQGRFIQDGLAYHIGKRWQCLNNFIAITVIVVIGVFGASPCINTPTMLLNIAVYSVGLGEVTTPHKQHMFKQMRQTLAIFWVVKVSRSH